ncbi:MAG: hypothetical protein QM749_09045 [Aquabacterium sp.]
MKSFAPSLTALATALLGLLASCAHAAGVQNGDFAQGLQGWQTAGDASVQSTSAVGLSLGNANATLLLGTAVTFTDDDAPAAPGAYNLSGNDPVLSGDPAGLEASLGLPLNALGSDVYEGSSAKQTFTVSAGDVVSFDFMLATHGLPMNEPDTAWMTWQAGSATPALSTLASTSPTMGSMANGWFGTGWQHVSFTAGSSGQFTLGFAVADVGSFTTTSLLGIQNVAVTAAVPEPESLTLVLTGLVLLGAAARRVHQS